MQSKHSNGLGALLKTRRLDLGQTLAEVGKELGLANGNFIGMVERGERMPSDARLLAMAKILDLDGRDLLAQKYEESHAAAAQVLLRPREPELPRMRKLLLDLCANRGDMTEEFSRGERTAIERLVFRALIEYVVLPQPALAKLGPKPLRERIQRLLKADPTAIPDPWWFEEEAESIVPWIRRQGVTWGFDLPTLTLRIRHSTDEGDVSTVPLVDRELRERLLASAPSRGKVAQESKGLADILLEEGLSADDVEEILDLIEWKKSRSQRSVS